MEEKSLDPQKSVEIIQQMIAQTRDRLEDGGGKMFLLWGYLSFTVSAIVQILIQYTGNINATLLWWLIPIIGYPTMKYLHRKRGEQVYTYIDRFTSYVWIVVGAACVLVPVAVNFSPISGYVILPVEALLLSVGVTITGFAIKYKPITIGGFVSMLLSFVMFTALKYYILIFMLIIVVSMIIPGHILNYKGRCSES